MSVAFDASSRSGSVVSASVASFSWTHTPVGTPRGVTVVVAGSTSATNDVTGVTYGGVTVPRVSSALAVDSAGEPCFVDVYHLGVGVPTGAQTVVVNRNNNANGVWAAAATVTAAADTEVYNAGIVLLQGDQALAETNVSDGSTGVDSLRFGILSSGAVALTPAGANTTRIQTVQPSSRNIDFYRETTAGQGSRPIGAVNATADDVAMTLFAVREVVGGATQAIAPGSINSSSSMTASVVRVRPVTPAAISSTSTMTASIGRIRPIVGASISSTSSVSATVGRSRPLTVASIASTSTMTAALGRGRAVVPAAINSTSTVTATVVHIAALKPASISSTSTLTGSVVRLATVKGAAISSTSTITASLGAVRRIAPASILSTSTITATIIGGTGGGGPVLIERTMLGVGL